jgi:hypothetical protein
MASIESMRVVARHLNVLVRRGGYGTMIPKIGSFHPGFLDQPSSHPPMMLREVTETPFRRRKGAEVRPTWA